MTINNTARTKADEKIVDLRNAIEHRATWFYLLLDEAEKAGADWEKIATLCDIAMEGDRGIVNEFPDFEFRLGDTIAKGGKVCCIEIIKKK